MQQLNFFEVQAPRVSAATPPAENFSLLDSAEQGRGLAKTWKERAADNIAAIRLAQRIEAEFRPATLAECAQLIRFVGFGASDLANSLFPTKAGAFGQGWEQLGQALHAVAGREVTALARATQYAHFTPEYIVTAMWDAVRRFGFDGGRVLEPGCGTGLFLALAPKAIAQASVFVGIERDPITARIARLLHPLAHIETADFGQRHLPRCAEPFDLVIGNPPFSDRTVTADDAEGAGKLGLSLHEFFILRAVRMLRPGGLGAFVTSRYLMDKGSDLARAVLAADAELLGAIRLPRGSMRAAAGTDVVVDLLFLRRRDKRGAHPLSKPWVALGSVACTGLATSCTVNSFFAETPEAVLGNHAFVSSQHGPAYTCAPEPGLDLPGELAAAAERLASEQAFWPADAVLDADEADPVPDVNVRSVADGGTLREGSYFVDTDRLWQIVDGRAVAVAVKAGRGTEGIFQSHAAIIRGLIPIRDAVRDVLRAQVRNSASWAAEAARLRGAYDAFVKKHGPINHTVLSTTTVDDVVRVTDPETGEVLSETLEQRERTTARRPNLAPFLDDPDVWLVSSIESYDVDTGIAKPGAVFTERVIRQPTEPVIASAADALAVVLNEVGRVDIPRIGGLIFKPPAEVIRELGAAIFEDPETEQWVTADAYLSGAVRGKLKTAQRAAAEAGARYQRNVEALEAVQPTDLKPSEITARLGAPWVPVPVVERFILEVMRVRTTVHHTPAVASWTVEQPPFKGNAASTSEWGTQRRHAGDLLEDALNASIPRIYDVERDSSGKEIRTFNAAATEAAKEKLEKIKRAFEAWVWKEPSRADRLVRIYNDDYNNLVPRHFDGAHLQLPDASGIIEMRPHQKRGVWRVITAGSTYLAHAVGAGKTFLMAAALMEQKRLGLVSKPMMVVPGHCLAQAAREFLMLYPTARILVADETNFVKEKRQRFIARAATGNWDCIILTHSAFKFIPAPGAFERSMINEQLANYEELLLSVDENDRVGRKRLERLKEGFEERLDRLSSRKDDVVTIAEIGVDQIVVDEAQEFRKLSFATNMGTLRGIDPDGSQRAWDLYVKVKFIAQSNPTRPLIMASGTPITNTMGELFTLMRFMHEVGLIDRLVHQFDAWASTFGETRTDLELQPSGLYKPATRFSQFVNVAELIAMFRAVADVVLKDDLRGYMKLPRIKGGKRQILTFKPTPAFRAYQKELAHRIALIEQRKGMPKKGQDIILSVIGDGRHAALDMRFTGPDAENEPENKLNGLIANAFKIWQETSGYRYTNPATGEAYPLPGATQMIFSDLGTLNAVATRGFSAYAWIRTELIRLGVPAEQIAIIHHYKRAAEKLALFADLNSGRKRFVIGSSEKMGTGVNAQQRLIAMHHLDVPWLPSWIEQREGRIDRQGNQNDEIGLFAYATTGSMDAPMWQFNERKARFIAAALSGDRSIRRLDDVGDTVDQFAFAKALSSGDARLMQKAGLEAELARLHRLKDSHFDDQYNVRQRVDGARGTIVRCQKRIPLLEMDLDNRVDTRADLFQMTVDGKAYTERKAAGAALLAFARARKAGMQDGEWTIAQLGGFAVKLDSEVLVERSRGKEVARSWFAHLWIMFSAEPTRVSADVAALEPLGLVARLENAVRALDYDLTTTQTRLADAEKDLREFEAMLQDTFEFQDELDAKTDELLTLNESLARNTEAPVLL